MESADGIGLKDVQAVYSGPEGDLWELIMGEQIHIGGFASSMDLAAQAAIKPGTCGVDLCCCSGAGMRFLVRFKAVAAMTGVDATQKVIDRGPQDIRNFQEILRANVPLVVLNVAKKSLAQTGAFR